MDKKYVMPVPKVGPAVWYPARQGFEPCPAVITDVGINQVNITVYAPYNRGGLPYDGVRHIGDPSVDKQAGYNAGVWDFTEDTKRLAKLEGDVARLLEAFGEQPAV